jgi:DNA-binding beta-propeller fold protein YncE
VLDHDVDGKMGEIGYDPTSKCMYFAAPRAGRLEVLDSTGMKTLQSVKDLNEPNGIAIVADQRKLLLTCGDGSVKIFDIAADGSVTEKKSVSFAGDADPIRYDAKGKKAYFGHGMFLDWVDPATGDKSPKSIKLESSVRGVVLDPDSDRLFLTVADKGQVVVVDRAKWAIEATWTLKDASGDIAIDLDNKDSKLFVCCNNPDKLLILDAKDGKELDRLNIGSQSGGCWWDPVGKRVYVSCNNQISMIRRVGDKFSVEHEVDTAAGARTSLFIPERRRYIVCTVKSDYPPFVYIYVLPDANQHNEAQPKHR